MGYFFERVGRAFSFIWAAITMAFKDKDLFIPSVLALFANLAYVALIIIALNATGTLWLIGMEQQDIENLKAAGRVLRDGPEASLEEAIEEEKRAAEEAEAQGISAEEYMRQREAERQAATAARREAREKSRSRQYARAAFGVVTLFGAILITYIFSAMTVSLVYDHLSGKDARIGEAFGVAMKRLPGIVLLAVISTIVAVLAQAARDRRKKNVIGAIIGSLIETLWTIASFLILPAIVIHKLTLWQGLKRAKEIAVGNLLIVGVGEIAVGLVGNLIAFVGVAGGFMVGFFTYRVIPQPFYIPVGLGGVVALVAIAFTVYVKQAYYTCLYMNAVESAKLHRRAEARGPLAAALS